MRYALYVLSQALGRVAIILPVLVIILGIATSSPGTGYFFLFSLFAALGLVIFAAMLAILSRSAAVSADPKRLRMHGWIVAICIVIAFAVAYLVITLFAR